MHYNFVTLGHGRLPGTIPGILHEKKDKAFIALKTKNDRQEQESFYLLLCQEWFPVLMKQKNKNKRKDLYSLKIPI